MQKAVAGTGLATEYRTIFDLSGVPPFQQFFNFGVFVWEWIWKGFYKPWHIIPAPTIANPKAERELFRLNIAKAVCAEMAGLIWGEECSVNVSINNRKTDDDNPDPLNVFIQKVLTETSGIAWGVLWNGGRSVPPTAAWKNDKRWYLY